MKPTTGIDIEFFRQGMLITARATGESKAIPNLTTRRSHSLAWHAWQWLMRKIGGR